MVFKKVVVGGTPGTMDVTGTLKTAVPFAWSVKPVITLHSGLISVTDWIQVTTGLKGQRK